jgi:hypothetical protein
MFKNTMAVGPLEPAEFCVTGGTGVANVRICTETSLVAREVLMDGLTIAPAALRERCAKE